MRVALYIRVSTRRQADEGTSLEDQKHRLEQYACGHGWILDPQHVFCDDGYSGAKLDRPALDRLRDCALYAPFDRILITTPDRLARNFIHQLLLLDEFESWECEVEFLDQPFCRTPENQMMLQIRGAVAEYERALITERTRRGRLTKLRAGLLLPWTRVPFGYRTDPEKPRAPSGVRLHPFEANVVRDIFGWYLEGNTGLNQLASRLDKKGILTPKGKQRWNPSTLGKMLCNPAYIGKAYGNRYQSVEASRRQSALQKSKPKMTMKERPKEEWIEVSIPAIIAEETFELVKQKMANNKKRASRNNKSRSYLLRCLVSCGHCSQAIVGRGRGKYQYYVCNGRRQRPTNVQPERCQAPYLRSELLDALVWEDLCRVIREPELVEAALERAKSGLWSSENLQRRQRQVAQGLVRLEQQSKRLLDAYLAEVVELDEYKQKKTQLEREQKALERQAIEFEQTIEQEVERKELATEIEKFTSSIREGLEEVDFAQRRELIELLIDRVVVKDEEIEIRYVLPTKHNGPHYPFCRLCLPYLAHGEGGRGRHPTKAGWGLGRMVT